MPLVREPPSAVEGVCGLGFHSEPQNNFFGTTEGGRGDEWEQDEERLTQAFAAGKCWTQCAESHTGIRPGFRLPAGFYP